MMSLKLLTVLLVGFVVVLFVSPTHADVEVAEYPPADPAIIEDIVNRLNTLRTQRGLQPYQLHPLLNTAAQDQAMWLVETGLRGHRRPDGSTPRARVESAGYHHQGWCCGENYYMSIDATPDLVWNFWVNSRSHYNNLTNWNFKDVGIGMTTDGYRFSYVMVFATPFDPVQMVDASSSPPQAAPSAPEGTTITTGEYLVQAGENLFRIAQRYGVSVEMLAAANGIDDPRLLSVGQVLVIPGAGSQDAQAVAVVEPQGVLPTTPATAPDGTHVVQAGENLYRIAMRYGASVDALAAANGISDPRLLSVGQVLVVAEGGGQ